MKTNKNFKKLAMILLALTLAFGAVAAVPVTTEASTSGSTLKKKVKKVVSANVKSSDSKKTKMKKLFKYMEKNYTYYGAGTRGFHVSSAEKGWDKDFALEMIKDEKGSCFHYAACYAYMIKYATGYTVRIGAGKTNGFSSGNLQDHAWTEVKIDGTWYICDVNLDKYGADSTLKYYLVKRSKLKKTYNNFKDVTYVTVKF